MSDATIKDLKEELKKEKERLKAEYEEKIKALKEEQGTRPRDPSKFSVTFGRPIAKMILKFGLTHTMAEVKRIAKELDDPELEKKWLGESPTSEGE